MTGCSFGDVPMDSPNNPIDAVIFDTDGVVTRTASVHFAAWKRVFDTFLSSHARGDAAAEFTDADYRHHVDGIGRYDGVDAMLRSRGIILPWGDPQDPPGDTTVCAVANTKNEAFEQTVARDGVRAYETTRGFIDRLHAAGIRTAVISASRNCRMVLEAAGMDDLFEVRVDGLDQAELGFPGKPAPDVFELAAERLGVEPSRAAVVEDAISGVSAGRAGGFGLVIGLDRSLNPAPLAEHADLVVPDVADLEVLTLSDGSGAIGIASPPRCSISELPEALDDHDFSRRTEGRSLAVFLDYDGTLTPVVPRPEDARISPEMHRTLVDLSERVPVAIVSGRDLQDVIAMVGGGPFWFSGSHGFDVLSPDGDRIEVDLGAASRPVLDTASTALEGAIGHISGAWVERKRFATAVHYRATPEEMVDELAGIVGAEVSRHEELRLAGGKKIFELRPAVDWHKGRAITWLMDAMGLEEDVVAVFVGDDLTDEDGFVELRNSGVGVVVADPGDPDAMGRNTAALDRVDDPDRVAALLDTLGARG